MDRVAVLEEKVQALEEENKKWKARLEDLEKKVNKCTETDQPAAEAIEQEQASWEAETEARQLDVLLLADAAPWPTQDAPAASLLRATNLRGSIWRTPSLHPAIR